MDKPIPNNSPLFQHSLILFDGICNLCDHTVNFIIKRDHNKTFRFVPLQSPLGRTLLIKFGFPADYRESFVLIDGTKAYTKSTAFIRISKRLCKPWPLFSLTIVIPQCIRDYIYTQIGKNRYHWFGKHEYCETKQPNELNDRFLINIPSVTSITKES